MKVYKLRNRETGKFSNGGFYGRESVEGKTWSSLKNLKSHLRMKYTFPVPGVGDTVIVPPHWEVYEGSFEPIGSVVMLAKELFNVS